MFWILNLNFEFETLKSESEFRIWNPNNKFNIVFKKSYMSFEFWIWISNLKRCQFWIWIPNLKSEFEFSIWILNLKSEIPLRRISDSKYKFKIRIQNTNSKYEFKIRIQNTNSKYEFKIQIPAVSKRGQICNANADWPCPPRNACAVDDKMAAANKNKIFEISPVFFLLRRQYRSDTSHICSWCSFNNVYTS